MKVDDFVNLISINVNEVQKIIDISEISDDEKDTLSEYVSKMYPLINEDNFSLYSKKLENIKSEIEALTPLNIKKIISIL